MRRTAESVVFTLWPPAPVERITCISMSAGLILHVHVLGLGHHRHRDGGGVDAALRLGGRHALHAVHAATRT